MTRYRDEARVRLAAEPPDAGFHSNGRRRWRDRVARVACCLDRLGADEPTLEPILRLAFRALLPLADPGWWRAHPRARLNAETRRRLREIDKCRRRAERRGRAATGLGRLRLRAFGAAAIYARHGDVPALDLALRLIDHLDEALAGAGAAPPATGRERRTGCPAAKQRQLRPLGAACHNAGAADAAPGKEEDV